MQKNLEPYNDSMSYEVPDLQIAEGRNNVTEEEQLAQNLKDVCDENGKETNPAKSAPIFRQLGKLYQCRSHDMLCLIKSTALFNAAIVRAPTEDKEEIEKDLNELCSLILHKAGADDKTANLVNQSKCVKQAVNKMRERVEDELSTIPQIPEQVETFMMGPLKLPKIVSIQSLQNQITKDYTQIMADVAKYCQDVMGCPPCKYALLGMGSLARKEITPYSDFEHIIVLENMLKSREDAMKYFKWFSIIFHTIIINLQETILPSVNIYFLNDKASKLGDWFFDAITPRGISFDGMMPHACKFPLGRQQQTQKKPWKTELIKPVTEMLEYLSSGENLKNGYHLSDILTKVCYVCGDQKVFAEFDGEVKKRLVSHNREAFEEMKQQVSEDLSQYATSSYVRKNAYKKLNIKQVIYRSTTLFISALGRKNNIPDSSCFDIVAELAQKRSQSSNYKDHLMFAVAVACEIRLRWYSQNKCQCDTMECKTGETTVIDTFLGIVGKSCVITYFQIAYALQCECAVEFFLEKKSLFFSHPMLLSIILFYTFDEEERLQFVLEKHRDIQIPYNNYFFGEKCGYGLEGCLSYFRDDERKFKIRDRNQNANVPAQLAKNFRQLGGVLLVTLHLEDALECFQKCDDFWRKKWEEFTSFSASPKSTEIPIGYTFNEYGCKIKFSNDRSTSPGDIFIKFSSTQNLSHNLEVDINFSDVRFSMGDCLMQLNKPKDALEYFEAHLKTLLLFRFYKPEGLADWCYEDERIANMLNHIGNCLLNMDRFTEAIDYLYKVKLMFENFPRPHDSEVDRSILKTIIALGCSFVNNGNHDEGCRLLKMALNMEEKHSNSSPFVRIITGNNFKILNAMVKSFLMEKKTAEAINYLDELLSAREDLSLNYSHIKFAADLHYIAKVFVETKLYKKALKCLEASLDISIKLTRDIDTDSNIADILYDMGNCLFNRKQLEQARSRWQQCYQIRRKIAEDKSTADVMCEISKCLLSDDHVSAAISWFNASLQQNFRSAQDVNASIAGFLRLLSDHLIKVERYKDATIHLKQLLDVTKTDDGDAENRIVALDLFKMGLCLVKTNQSIEDAAWHLENSLKIQERISFDVKSDDLFARTLHQLGLCFISLNEKEKAHNYLLRSLEIQENTSIDIYCDKQYAETMLAIGRCLETAQ